MEYAKKLKNIKSIRIQSNGRRLSDYIYCKDLVEAGVNEFFISIYGHNSKIHDSLTRRKGSFLETIRGLENLMKLKVDVITNTVVTKLNYKFLPRTIEKVSALKNIKQIEFWNYLPMNAIDDCNLLESNINIRPPLIMAIEEAIRNKKEILIKYFPECLLGKYKFCLNNEQSDIIIDERFWGRYKHNFFCCLFKPICRSFQCLGLPSAYIKKFGNDYKIISPISE